MTSQHQTQTTGKAGDNKPKQQPTIEQTPELFTDWLSSVAILQRTLADPRSLTPVGAALVQRTLGNQALQLMGNKTSINPSSQDQTNCNLSYSSLKMIISRQFNSTRSLQRKCACGKLATYDNECDSCKQKLRAQTNWLSPISTIQRQSMNQLCRGTNRRAGPEHEAIQYDFILTKDPTAVREFAIPGGSQMGNTGYADLVSLGTYGIYEIKTYAGRAAGAIQVSGYLTAAQNNCDPAKPWHLGMAYPGAILPLAGDRELVARQYGQPGLILYYIRKKERKRKINWQQVAEVVLALGLSLALVPVILAALVDLEPASKLALAGLSVVMIGKILNIFGLDGTTSTNPEA